MADTAALTRRIRELEEELAEYRQARVGSADADLEDQVRVWLALRRSHLPPGMCGSPGNVARLLALLLARPGEVVRVGAAGADGIVKVATFHARRLLAELAPEVVIETVPWVGLRMTRASAAALLARVVGET